MNQILEQLGTYGIVPVVVLQDAEIGRAHV